LTRADRVSAWLAERGLDALLVSDSVNLRYLTGFSGSNGLAVVGTEGARLFITDFRYSTQSAEQVDPSFERQTASTDLIESLAPTLEPGRLGLDAMRLGFDDVHVSVRTHERLMGLLPAGVELVGAGGLVERMRAVKEPVEIERIRVAAALIDELYGWIAERGLAGRSEREVAIDLEHEMRHLGAEAPSFPSIVASGSHSALPHAAPREDVIPEGTLVTIDIGARLDGYCSDCTRTFATGALGAEETQVYELVLAAQTAALEAVAPGPTGREVDAVAREIIAAAGHGEHFGHGLGHGVGMEVHEGPRLARVSGTAALEAGNVVTIEPGVYLPGRFGVRIEDLVVVVAGGYDRLSAFPKELLTVG
jgi:Xaa-Pro aminopeptidase